MNILDKFRSLLVIDILPEKNLRDFNRLRPGGIVVRRRCTQNPKHLKALIAAHQKKSVVPLLVAANFEYGVANDVRGARAFFPGLMALAAATRGSGMALARAQARTIAREARSLGVNTLFGPVIDIAGSRYSSDGTRLFSNRVPRVAEFASAYVRGVQAGGLCAVSKHFPSSTFKSVDSHIDLPVGNHTVKDLSKASFVTFKRAIAGGSGAVMVCHSAYPKISRGIVPSTMSPQIIGLLKKHLKFKGFTITDNMGMGAVARHYSVPQALLNPIRAGVDLVLIGTDSLNQKVFDQCGNAPEKDPELRHAVEAAFQRMAWFRKKWKMGKAWGNTRILENQSLKMAEKIAERSITVIRDPHRLLPVTPDRYESILIISPQAKDGFHVALRSNFGYLAVEIKKRFLESDLVFHADSPPKREIRKILLAAEKARLVVLELHEEPGIHGISPGKMALARAVLKAHGKKTVIAGMESPVILNNLPRAGAAVFSFSAMPVSQIALARAVCGTLKPLGKNPIA
jgi:beta-N-acetylhexosaminidase